MIAQPVRLSCFLGILTAVAALALASPAAAAKHLTAAMRAFDGAGGLIEEALAYAEDTVPGEIFTLGLPVDPAAFPNATLVTRPDGSMRDIFGICACGPGGAYALGFATFRRDPTSHFAASLGPPPPPPPPPEFGPPQFPAKSLFDVFFDLSLDGGATWMPAGPNPPTEPYIEYWSDDGVPEPSTWALMIGGFGLVGAALRRRRGSGALAS